MPNTPAMWPGDDGTRTSASSGANNDPFRQDNAVLAMQPNWQTMFAVTSGTDYIRWNANRYLPKEPREDDDAWASRVARSVLSPFTVRLVENAAGLVLRRPIQVQGDDYWLEFAENVDGLGSSINEFARRALVSSLTLGHSGILVDYPKAPGALTLAEERAVARRPYFNQIDATQIWGWRQENELPSADLTQIRLHEWVDVPVGDFGEERMEQIRVIYKNRYEIYRRNSQTGGETGKIASGALPLGLIPFVPLYTNRLGMLTSAPLLLDVANLNITHYQRQADLLHALHIAAMPILVLEGWSDQSDTSVGVNYAMAMEPGNKAYYVQSDSTSFQAQAEELTALEQQMSHLGVTKLLGQKFVAESADAKRIDQSQANSVLSIISMELESGLNQAFQLAARYLNIEPPTISLERDFDFYRLLGQDISVLNDVRASGAMTTETFLKILRQGEILPDSVDLQEELEAVEAQLQQQQAMSMLQSTASIAAQTAPPASGGGEEGAGPQPAQQSELRSVLEQRLRAMVDASPSNQNDEEEEG